jgi:integrase
LDGVFGKRSKSPETVRRVLKTCRLVVEILGDHHVLDELTQEDVSYLLTKMHERRKTPKSYNVTLRTIRLMFKDAERYGKDGWRLRHDSPLLLMQTVAEPRKLPAFMKLDTTEAVMAFLMDFPLGVGPLLGLLCGLRKSEADGVMWKNLREVPFAPTPAEVAIEGNLGKGNHERVVPMPAKLFEKLGPRPDDQRTALSPNVPEYAWRAAKTAMRFRHPEVYEEVKDMGFHALRHSCARWYYYRANMEMAGLRDFLGHSSVETTMRYLEGGNERAPEQVAKVDEVFK